MRLWRTSNDTRDADDYIAPDQTLTWPELGGDPTSRAVTVYVQALDASVQVDDHTIEARVFPDLISTNTYPLDIAFSTFGWHLGEISGAQQIVPATEMLPSFTTPVVTVTSYDLSNLHFNEDYTAIYGSIHVSGSVDDPVSDLVPGDDGSITLLQLFVNGATTPYEIVTLNVSKGDNPSSLLHPFDYSGTFDVMLTDVLLRPGNNLVRLVADRPLDGASGSADVSLAVGISEPSSRTFGVGVILDWSSPSSLSAQVRLDGGAWHADSLTETQAGSGTFTSSDGSLTIHVGSSIVLNPLIRDTLFISVTDTTLGITNHAVQVDEDSAPSGHFTGGEVEVGPTGYPDYRGSTVTTGASEVLPGAPQGEFHPYVLELDGPSQLLARIQRVELSGGARGVVQFDGRFLMSTNDPLIPPDSGSFSGWGAQVIGVAPQPRPAVLQVRPAPRETSALSLFVQNYAEAAASYWPGFAYGFAVDGAWGDIRAPYDLVQGAWSLGKWAYKKTTNAVSAAGEWVGSTTAKLWYGNGDTFESAKEMAAGLGQEVEMVAELAWKMAKGDPDVLWDVLAESETVLAGIGENFRKTLVLAGELFEYLGNEIKNLDDYTQGRVIGFVTYTAMQIAVTAGAGTAALIPKLRACSLFAEGSALGKAVTLLEKALTLFDCLAPGTLVQTDRGQVPVESIQTGDLVLAQDVLTGERLYKPVLRTMQNQTRVLYEVEYALPLGEGEPIVDRVQATAEHPFYVIELHSFVPAERLIPGHHLLLADGATAQVSAVTSRHAAPGQVFTVHNLEVADLHNYFVDEAGVLVHNAEVCTVLLRKAQKAISDATTKSGKLAGLSKLAETAFPNAAKHASDVQAASSRLMESLYAAKKALGEYPTADELTAAINGATRRLEKYGMDVHHLIDQHLIRDYWPHLMDKINTMPGWLIDAGPHRIWPNNITIQFREIEETFMAALAREGSEFDGVQLRRLLASQYPGPGSEGILHALDLWLKRNGI